MQVCSTLKITQNVGHFNEKYNFLYLQNLHSADFLNRFLTN